MAYPARVSAVSYIQKLNAVSPSPEPNDQGLAKIQINSPAEKADRSPLFTHYPPSLSLPPFLVFPPPPFTLSAGRIRLVVSRVAADPAGRGLLFYTQQDYIRILKIRQARLHHDRPRERNAGTQLS